METEYIIVLTAAPKEDEARKLADALIEKRLAACVQIESIESVYRWKGEIESGPETRLTIKTRRALLAEVEETIKSALSETTPEILAVPVAGGSDDYLDWLESSTDGRS